MRRARALAALLLASTLSPVPNAYAEEVQATITGFSQGDAGGAFTVVGCYAKASGAPASTEVWCQINSADPEYFGAPGPATAAVWYGSADMPVRACVWARATYRNLDKVYADKKCEYLTPSE